MTSNALSTRRNTVPRPAICKSKQAIWPFSVQPWLIPATLSVHLTYGGGSGSPPEWFRDFHWKATRMPNRLIWHCFQVLNGTTYVLRFDFNVITGLWSFDYFDSPTTFDETAFKADSIPELPTPYRHAAHTEFFPSSTGEYLTIQIQY